MKTRNRYPDLRDRLIGNSVPDDVTDCWHWIGRYTKGYGQVNLRVRGRHITVKAHRLAYELWNGPIPEDFTIDHLCETTSCINPAHLEAVPNPENARRRWYRKR